MMLEFRDGRKSLHSRRSVRTSTLVDTMRSRKPPFSLDDVAGFFGGGGESSSGLSKMFAAAVVNRQFRDMLLSDPSTALDHGYLGETFSLTKEERDLLVSIRAASIGDLARQVSRSLRSKTE